MIVVAQISYVNDIKVLKNVLILLVYYQLPYYCKYCKANNSTLRIHTLEIHIPTYTTIHHHKRQLPYHVKVAGLQLLLHPSRHYHLDCLKYLPRLLLPFHALR